MGEALITRRGGGGGGSEANILYNGTVQPKISTETDVYTFTEPCYLYLANTSSEKKDSFLFFYNGSELETILTNTAFSYNTTYTLSGNALKFKQSHTTKPTYAIIAFK